MDTLPTMLWSDTNKKRKFETKLQRAISYYEEKYGQRPQVCGINTDVLEGLRKDGLSDNDELLGVKLIGRRFIQPYHFHITARDSIAGPKDKNRDTSRDFTSVVVLGLSGRIATALKKADIHTIGQLKKLMDSNSLRSIKGVGKKSMLEIRLKLQKYYEGKD